MIRSRVLVVTPSPHPECFTSSFLSKAEPMKKTVRCWTRLLLAGAALSACGDDQGGALTHGAFGSMTTDVVVRTISCDGVSAGVTTLLNADVRDLPSYSTLAWVRSRSRGFRLVPRRVASDGRELFDASDGRQWSDLGEDSPVWQSRQSFWSVDPVGGSDDAAGWGDSMESADRHPLKSFGELWRRWRDVTLGSVPVTIHLLSSMSPGADSAIPPSTINGTSLGTAGMGSTIHIVGKPTLIHAGTLTGVRPFTDRSGNGKYILQDANWTWAGGISSRTSDGGRLIKKTGAGVYSMVLTQESATEVSVNVPLASDPNVPAHPVAGDQWTVGDSYELYTLPTTYDMGSTNVQTSYAQVNLGRLGYGTVTVSAAQPMRMNYVAIQENLLFTGNLLAGGLLFMDDTQFRGGRWDLFHCGAVGTGDSRMQYLNGLAYLVKFTNNGFRQYVSSQAFVRISGAQFYDVHYAGGVEGPPALMTCDETGTILIDDSVRGYGNAAFLFSIQTPQSRGIFGVTRSSVPVEIVPGWEDKVALYVYYSKMPLQVGWDGIPLNDLQQGGSFIGDGLQ